jgi:hypothetical protein
VAQLVQQALRFIHRRGWFILCCSRLQIVHGLR